MEATRPRARQRSTRDTTVPASTRDTTLAAVAARRADAGSLQSLVVGEAAAHCARPALNSRRVALGEAARREENEAARTQTTGVCNQTTVATPPGFVFF